MLRAILNIDRVLDVGNEDFTSYSTTTRFNTLL